MISALGREDITASQGIAHAIKNGPAVEAAMQCSILIPHQASPLATQKLGRCHPEVGLALAFDEK